MSENIPISMHNQDVKWSMLMSISF